MGEIGRSPEVRQALRASIGKLNPRRSSVDVRMYVDALVDYAEAQANIDEHGTVVFHPRTAAPIPNPYLSIRAMAARQLTALALKCDPKWGAP